MSRKATLKKMLSEVDSLMAEEMFDEAVNRIHDFGPSSTWNEEIADRLQTLAEHTPAAEYALGNYWVERSGAEAAEKAVHHYTRAAECDEQDVAAQANFVLALIRFKEDEGRDRAQQSMLRAAELGLPQAQFMAGMEMLRQAEEARDKKLKSRAVSLLSSAAGEGDIPEAKLFVAQRILDGTIKGSRFDPIILLSEAAVQGQDEAVELIMTLGIPEGGGADSHDPMLPYVVRPDGLKRPRLVRDALAAGFDLTQGEAETITAGFYGCPAWARLASIAGDARTPAGKFDEDLSAAELNERRKLLAGVLLHHFEMPPHVADVAIELLQPCSRNGDKPSLRRLEEKANGMMFKIGMNAPEPIAKKVYDDIGMTFDFDNAMRFAFRVQPGSWLPVMEDHFGWDIEEVDYDVAGEGVLVARSPTAEGMLSIYMSRVSHRPGDKGDEHVEKLMRQIDGKSERAALLFNIPIAYMPDRESPFGLLYGGKFRSASGKWSDFVLRPCGPGQGAADAASQQLTFSDEQPDALLEPYGFEDAGRIAEAITRHVRNYDGPQTCMNTGEGKWSLFIPSPLASEMKQFSRGR